MSWTDEELVRGCKANQPIAQRQLYEKFSNKMMGVCLRYAASTEEAQDILQDGFIKVFDKLHSYSGSGSLEGWVRRIMINTALDHLRRNKGQKQHLDLEDTEFLMPTDGLAIDSLATQDLLKVIQEMPAGFKMVFNMYAIEGYSHKEIAKELGISENTSKSQYSRARAYLQKIIKIEKIET